VLAASASLFVCSQFYRVANAVVAPHLQRELALSSEALGGLSAAFFYAFAAMQIPLALVLDRVGGRTAMTVLSLVGAAGAVVFATADARAGATLGQVLLGIGMAGNLMGSMKIVGHWFSPREFATVAGLLAALGTFGNILATTPLALLVGAAGWRRAFLLVAAATATLALLFRALVRERPGTAAPAPEPADAAAPPLGAMVRGLLSTRDYWLISIGTFCRYGSFVAIQGLWAGPYLVEVAELPPLRAANLLLLLNVSFVLGAPFGGWLSDRVLASRKRLVLLGLTGLAAAQLALALAPAPPRTWTVALVLVALGVASSWGQVVYVHMRDLAPPHMAGMAMTGVNFFTMLGGAAFTHGAGWVLDRWSGPGGVRGPEGYRAAFLAASLAVLVAVALYSFTRDAGAGGEGRRDPARAPARRPPPSTGPRR
jgi:nitrate/nitrite transporter NarK